MIPLERNLHPESKSEDEDWAGLSNATARRRLQNRLNQRAYRRRKADGEQRRESSVEESVQGSSPKTADSRTRFSPEMQLSNEDGLLRLPVSNAGQNLTYPINPAVGKPLDPLRILSPHLSDSRIQENWQYAAKIIWPGCEHVTMSPAESTTTQSFFRYGMADPLLFHACSWATFLHLEIRRPLNSYKTLGHRHQAMAMQLVQQEISTLTGVIRDELIFAICLLMSHDGLATPKENLYGGFKPLLTYLQWLNITSRIKWLDVHKDMLKRVIDMRGGIHNLQIPGLAELIQRFDIASVCHNLCKPLFPLCKSYNYILNHEQSLLRDTPRYPESSRPCSFKPLDLPPDFEDLLCDMRAYIDLIDLHCDGLYANPSPSKLATYRNLIQHRLLSLDKDEGNPNYELCRLGALIFSFSVIYPFSDSRPLSLLCHQLRSLLERCEQIPKQKETSSQRQHKLSFKSLPQIPSTPQLQPERQQKPPLPLPPPKSLIFWTTMLGAIAAAGTECAPWFSLHLASLLAKTVIPFTFENRTSHGVGDGDAGHHSGTGSVKWAQVKPILSSYLWQDRACDDGARDVWCHVADGSGGSRTKG